VTAEAASPPAADGMFSSLRIRNFRLYMTGLTVSVAGNWMQNVAVGWLVLQLTGSGTVLGVVTAAGTRRCSCSGPGAGWSPTGTTSGFCCGSPRWSSSSWPRCSVWPR
jgi:hypothetical protein